MKKLLKFVLFVGAVAGAAWALRDQLMPPPQTPSGAPPPFRTADESAGSGDEASVSPPADAGDDLERVNGIGPVRVNQLAAEGIATFAALADADAVDLAARIGVSVSQTEDWIGQAAELA